MTREKLLCESYSLFKRNLLSFHFFLLFLSFLNAYAISVFAALGYLHAVPHQLHIDDPHCCYLAHTLPCNLEVTVMKIVAMMMNPSVAMYKCLTLYLAFWKVIGTKIAKLRWNNSSDEICLKYVSSKRSLHQYIFFMSPFLLSNSNEIIAYFCLLVQ